ncbi:thiol reductant ABC exporter subunit CydD [Rhodococcus sp. 14-2483-1-1]|uniref:thiol reductant ABC exporter subunit CydD n=1 Tax=unclassified Rhodococcus (in: high G+C Gram-positive bacteria) TaxID=192944 RepID=UPI000B9A38F4|nr:MULTISPECIES: thiol reductant ABC exporter subunit CydD [unclassified Rhodococcus (in: high G+C Gram-positive bacteria)]OZC51434.1 thiol reductant ABC exporter subunit CydD [Rhodococcus sp. WWJCD1]OZF40428.1 thiol reductant ABC exporter subunit CydD [Rhodococcus sp. 14-2483-1-1]
MSAPARSRAPVDPRLWKYSRSARGYLVTTVGLSTVVTLCIIVSALAIGRVLAGVITDPTARSLSDWTTELVVLGCAMAVRVLAAGAQSRYAHRSASRVVAELELEVLTTATRFEPRELDSEREELAVVVTRAIGGLRAYLIGYVPALVLAVIVTPLVLVVILTQDVTSAVIIAVTLPLIPIFMILIGLLTKGRAAATLTTMTRLSAQLLDLLAGLPTLRALGREHGPAARIRALGDAHRRTTMRALKVAFLSSMVLELLATLCVALVAVGIGLRLVFGEMTLEAGIVALILAPEVYFPLRSVGTQFHAAEDGVEAAGRAFRVLDRRTVRPSGGRTVDASAANIELDGLTVTSRDGEAPAELSAVCRAGTVTVLTGPNGAGKSTALQAILGLTTPSSGAVRIGGVPVAELDLDQWWAQVAWLPQRPVLLPGTLYENVTLHGVPNSDALIAACRSAGFDEVLRDHPAGWDTCVGQGGVGLSLGELQRLALTRTFVSNASVMVLDEPTAHLDSAREKTVLQAVRAAADRGVTVVMVGHRRSVLHAADRVVEVRSDATLQPKVDHV